MARLKLILGRVGRALGWTVGGAAVLLLGVYLALISSWGNELILEEVSKAAQPSFPGGALVIDGLDTNLLTGIEVHGVAIQDKSGKTLVGIDRVALGWELGGLLNKTLVVHTAEVQQVEVDLTMLEDGTLDIQKVFGPPKPDEPSEPWTGLPIDIEVPQFSITQSRVKLGGATTPVDIPSLSFSTGVFLDGAAVHVDHLDLDVDLQAPVTLPVRTEGELIFTGADLRIPQIAVYLGDTLLRLDGAVAAVQEAPVLDVGVALEPLAPSTLESLAGEPVLKQAATYEGRLTGTMAALTLDSTLASEGLGSLDVDVVLGLESDPMIWDVRVEPKAFKVDGLAVAVPVPVTLAGVYAVRGSGTEWPAGIQAEIDLDGGDQILAGESVASLQLDAVLEAGQLAIEGFSATHSAGSVALTGDANLVDSTAAIDVRIKAPTLGALSAYGAPPMSGSAGFVGHVDAGWAPTIRADVDGTVSLQSVYSSGTRLQSGQGKVQATVRGDDISASGDLEIKHITASGASVASVGLRFEGGQSAAGDVAVDAGIDIGSIAMDDGSFEMAGLGGTVSARVPARGQLVAKADLDVEEFKLNKGAYVVQGGPIVFEAKGDDVWADIDIRRQDAPFLKGRIDGNLKTGQWRVSGFEFSVKPQDGLVADQNISVTLGDDGAESVLVEINNRGGRGYLRLEGRATASDPDIHLQAKAVNLAYVMEMLDELMGAGEERRPVHQATSTQNDDDGFAPVFPGEQGEPQPAADQGRKAARTEQRAETEEEDKPSEPKLSGLASLDLRLKKSGDAFVASGWVELEGLAAAGTLAGAHARVGFDLKEDQATVDIRLKVGEQVVLISEGQVPLSQADGAVAVDCDGQMDLRTVVPALKLSRLAKQVPALAGTDGRVSMDLWAKGRACDPDLTLVAASDAPVGSQGERARVDLEFKRIGDKVVLKTTLEEDQKRLARVDSEVEARLTELLSVVQGGKSDVDLNKPETWLKSYDAAVVLESIPLEAVARLADVGHPLEGILGGGIHVGGTLEKPEIQAGFTVLNGRIGDAAIQRGSLEFMPSDDNYRLDSQLVFDGGGSLGIQGTLPLDLATMDLGRPGLDIRLSGAGLPLAMGAGPGALIDPTGLMSLEGQIGGTLAKPEPVLALKMDNAGFTLAQAGLRYSPVNVDMGFSPERIDIRKFEVQTKPFWTTKAKEGTLNLRGTVALDGGEPTAVDLVAELEQFWLSSIKLASLATTGEMAITGTFPDLNITGSLTADEARFEVTEADLAESSGLEMDKSIQIHREKAVTKVVVREDESSIADDFNVGLKLDLQQRLNLKAEIPLSSDFGSQFSQLAAFKVELTLDGDLDIVQRRGEMGMAGEVVPLRGFLEVLGKRFDMEEGRLVFTGANFTSPVLDLSASHQVGQYGTVMIKITGDVDKPQIVFSSDDYPDQTDVMSMLLFGKPTSAMSETEGESGSGLLSAALSTVGGQAARSSGAAFLQNLVLDPGSGSVKVGFPLSDKLYLAVERLQPEDETDNMTQASLEWILSRSTYAEVVTGDQGKSSGDVYWRWRF